MKKEKVLDLPLLRESQYYRLYCRVCDLYKLGMIDYLLARMIVNLLNNIDCLDKVKFSIIVRIESLLDSVQSAFVLIEHLRSDIDSYLDEIYSNLKK